ncbi:MAG: aminotransferase class III-fold pyridoxal phosphate-dependent enzyme, partial [Bacteroidota bacterium]
AIEMAVMLAKRHCQAWKTVSFEGTFHGSGFQAISIGADPHFNEGLGPLIPGAMHIEMPDFYRNPWGYQDEERVFDHYFAELRDIIEKGSNIAAFISEPIFYNSTVPTQSYWQQVKELCQRKGILLIFDEIYTAFGRTGKMFACEHFVTPDLLVFGKGFGGGVVPYAGIIGSDKLNTMPDRSIGHYTHEKSPFCAAVANAVIDCVVGQKLANRAEELGAYFKGGLEELKHEFQIVGLIQGLGLNLAVDLVEDRKTKERAFNKAHSLVSYLFERGVSLKLIQGNILNIKPALIIEKSEIDYVLECMRDGLELVSK